MNFLVEGVYLGTNGEEAILVVSSGVRWAINPCSVQVVPGLALPFSLSRRQESAVIFYFSVEHPFGPTGPQ